MPEIFKCDTYFKSRAGEPSAIIRLPQGRTYKVCAQCQSVARLIKPMLEGLLKPKNKKML